ncbi:MAG: hypothetical protein H0T79_04085 [Deltaproteobacteria bacterium]|nr:hypothetical protein [Deltaproteobacteria bacterium]
MALRRLLGCLPVAALALCASTACKDTTTADKGAAATAASTVDLDKRCVQLAKVCGDKDKHVEKIVEACKQAAKQQVANSCTDKVTAVYDCYEKELCASKDKVWTLDDLRVLADRRGKCVAERTAITACDK